MSCSARFKPGPHRLFVRFGGDRVLISGMTPDAELLRRYAEEQAEDAFAEVVQRYIGLVFSAALRQVNGNTALAQEVAQSVFTDLARKAKMLSHRSVLTGWLYTSVHYAAAKALRSERRRVAREQEAQAMQELLQPDPSEIEWTSIEPVLDGAMHELKERDREAILLRYFENRSFAEIGPKLGLGENAARMRVERALEKLRVLLSRRGITTASALSAAISGNAVGAAPAGLATALTSTSLATAGAGGGMTVTLLTIMATTKIKAGTVTLILIGCAFVPLLMQRKAEARQRDEERLLKGQASQIAAIEEENQRLSRIAASVAISPDQSNELQRLRAEAQALAPQTNAVAALRRENRRLQAALEKPANPLQIKEEIIATELTIRDWLVAFHQFAANNQRVFPTKFDEAAPYLPADAKTKTGPGPESFEIVYRGSLDELKNPGNVIVIRQKQPRPPDPSDPRSTWAKIYGFADGSVRLQQARENDFEEYERQHSAEAQTTGVKQGQTGL